MTDATMSSEGQNSELEDLSRGAAMVVQQIAEMKRSADELVTSLAEMKAQFDAVLLDAKSKGADIASIATQATAAQTQITNEQAVIATKSDHIQKAQEHADAVRANLDRVLTATKQQQTEAEGYKSRAQSAADTCAQLAAEVNASRTSTDADSEAVSELLEQARAAAAETKVLADKAEEIEKNVSAYEDRLAQFEAACQRQLKAIENLLPGATSAGLAHSFNERRKAFLNPGTRWQWIFVGSLVALVLVALTGLVHVYRANDVLSYDALFRLWLARLPIAGSLVWLALYASRESALAKRLEEDYGYKAAVAASFEGFHKQLSEVATSVDENSPLMRLCSDTLATVSSPPGRIYDKHELTISPTSELAEALKSMSEAVKRMTQSEQN